MNIEEIKKYWLEPTKDGDIYFDQRMNDSLYSMCYMRNPLFRELEHKIIERKNRPRIEKLGKTVLAASLSGLALITLKEVVKAKTLKK